MNNKSLFSFGFFCIFSLSNLKAQDTKTSRKSKFYAYWGWNRGFYTKSDITFKGENYNFKLQNVIGNDRQDKIGIDPYLIPGKATVPQYNFRVGYHINDRYHISLGVDHMKYVVLNGQTVRIDGTIKTNSEFDNEYNNRDIVISEDFLKFEHTDGLNYLNIELRKNNGFKNTRSLTYDYGIGIGALMPRTDATLIGKPRHDAWHFAGLGLSVVGAIKYSFLKHFFIQSELKGGFIHMPDIRTTAFKIDKASQHFFFTELAIVFGGNF
jgi:hypothetical protein